MGAWTQVVSVRPMGFQSETSFSDHLQLQMLIGFIPFTLLQISADQLLTASKLLRSKANNINNMIMLFQFNGLLRNKPSQTTYQKRSLNETFMKQRSYLPSYKTQMICCQCPRKHRTPSDIPFPRPKRSEPFWPYERDLYNTRKVF